MTSPSADPPRRAGALAALLEEAGVAKSSLIRVTGPDALPALIWLCRHGYDEVGYIRPDAGCPHESPDALILAHTCEAGELPRFLGVARRVRPGGVFVAQVHLGPDDDSVQIEDGLRAAGFAIEQGFGGGRRAVIVARRNAAQLRRAA